MKKRKVRKRKACGCCYKDKPEVCWDCYHKKSLEIAKKNRKITNRNYALNISISLLLAIIFLTPYIVVDVDEDEFCFDKISKHFPEYDFIQINEGPLNDNPSTGFRPIHNECVGAYKQESGEIRDGLKETSKDSVEFKHFKLINEEDVDYLQGDDAWGTLFVFGVVSLFWFVVSLAIALEEWFG